MLIFEYTRRYPIEPTSLINDAPSIWRWSNPYNVVADWTIDVFGIDYEVSLSNRLSFTSARMESTFMTTVYSYEDCVETVYSFFWDGENQTAYFNFDAINPHALGSVDLARLYGATDETVVEFEGISYPTILLSRPTVNREIEPVVYERMATQSISIDLRNDQLWRIGSNGKPEQYWRFDDITDIVGQTTFLKYGEEGDNYEDLRIIHKGVIVDYTLDSTTLKLSCDDIRSKLNVEWPTHTYEDEGYTSSDIEEGMLTDVIPDGYGDVKEIPAYCIDRDTHLLQFDDDTNELLNPPENKIDWDMTTWFQSSIAVTETTIKLAGFTLYTLQKTSSTGRASDGFTASDDTHRYSGYLKYGDTADGYRSLIRIYSSSDATFVAYLYIDFFDKTYEVTSGFTNVRVKFIEEDNEALVAYFSCDYESHVIGQSYSMAVDVDTSASNTSILFAAGLRVSTNDYVPFRCARTLTSVTKAYKYADETMVEISIINSDLPNGVVYLQDCDVHENGLMSNDLSDIYIDCRLRDVDNSMDMIVDLNLNLRGFGYVDSLYNKTIIETEKVKLAPVSLYLDSSEQLFSIIETLQGASTAGFRYDDLDKIYMKVDDPNRDSIYYIQRGTIFNRDNLVVNGNTTLYADVVAVAYYNSRRESKEVIYTNRAYQHDVLIRYNYENPLQASSLLTSEADAINKSIILLEDLSVTRPIINIQLYGLGVLDILDLYDIIKVDLSLSNTRTYLGELRCQVIGIEVDTTFNLVTLTVRQRDFSEAFGDITGSYGTVSVVGDTVAEIALGNELEETAIGHIGS